MAQGTQRREGTQDSLAGASEINPVLPQAPQLQVPNASVPDVVNNMSSQVARSLSKWSTAKFQEQSNKNHEKAILDGQMAFQQGTAMEELEMDGDKFAMQGYRVMQAQTLSATMLAAQQELITESQYQDDPDTFRAKYVQRMEAQVEGLDSKTARMVREQMAEHMPTLVAQHTTANMQFEEQNAFDSLAASVDAMSTDPTATAAFLSNSTGGVGTASAGLSDARRSAAIVSGTVAAFENGNPLAYQQLKSSGLLEELPHAEQQALEAGKKAYETKLANTYNEQHVANLAQYDADLAAGVFETPQAAVDAKIKVYAERGLTVSAQQANAAYAGAKVAGDLGDRADVKVLAAAVVRGDHATVAELTQDIVMFYESGGDPDAVSPVGATGLMQVMPATSKDPGYGVKASNGTPADTVRVGKEYWAAMVAGNKGEGSLNWEAGDIEAAAIAYNAGPENAKKWIEAGRDYSVLPKRSETEPYAKKILASANGEDLYYTEQERLSMADTALTAAQKLKTAQEKQEAADLVDAEKQAAIVREDLYNRALLPVNQKLQAGLITETEYRAEADALLEAHNVDLSRSISNAQVADVESATVKQLARQTKLDTEAAKNADDLATEEKKHDIASFGLEVQALNNVYMLSINSEGRSSESIDADRDAYMELVTQLAEKHGLTLAETKMGALVKESSTAGRAAKTASMKYASDQVLVDRAKTNGTVSDLPPKLQERAWKQMGEESQKLVSDAVASNKMPEDQAGPALAQAQTAMWIQGGSVPKDVTSHATAIMSRELVTDGVPNNQAISVIQQWDSIRQDNPEVAATMFSEAGALKAEALLEMAGGSFASPDALAQSMVAMQKLTDHNASLVSGNAITDNTAMSSQIMTSVDNFMSSEDIGWVQATFSGTADWAQRWDRLESEEQAVFADDAKAAMGGAITEEAYRLQKLFPNQNANFYSAKAAGNIMERTSIVGESIVVMDKGFSLKQQMFGDAAGIMGKDGVEQEVILDAIQALAAADPDKYGYTGTTTFREQSDFAWRGIYKATDAVAGIFGASFNQPVMSEEDAERSEARGARPFRIDVVDGKQVGIRILLPDGNLGPYLPIDLAQAGKAYRDKYLESIKQ